jgi:hypothetical protein
MATFTYNQFKNPNNNGIYYSDHFHDLNSGLNISSDHVHSSYYPHNSVIGANKSILPHLHKKWLIRESVSDNNQPIFRTQYSSSNYSNPNLLMQPQSVDDAEKWVPVIVKETVSSSNRTSAVSTAELDLNAGVQNLTSEKLRSIRSAAEQAVLEEAGLGSTTGTRSGLAGDYSTENITVSDVSTGIYSYVDYDQPVNSTDPQGGKYVNITPLKEALEESITYHGKPVQQESPNTIFSGGNINLTTLGNISGSHTHYFPLRGNIINGYVANDMNHSNLPTFPNKQIHKYYSKKAPKGMMFNLNNSHHHFRLF